MPWWSQMQLASIWHEGSILVKGGWICCTVMSNSDVYSGMYLRLIIFDLQLSFIYAGWRLYGNCGLILIAVLRTPVPNLIMLEPNNGHTICIMCNYCHCHLSSAHLFPSCSGVKIRTPNWCWPSSNFQAAWQLSWVIYWVIVIIVTGWSTWFAIGVIEFFFTHHVAFWCNFVI
jgi:hypothetical protein